MRPYGNTSEAHGVQEWSRLPPLSLATPFLGGYPDARQPPHKTTPSNLTIYLPGLFGLRSGGSFITGLGSLCTSFSSSESSPEGEKLSPERFLAHGHLR